MFKVTPFLNVDNLHELRNFFLTSMGPNGSYKMIVTSGGQVRVTSTSVRITRSLLSEITDPCAEAILHLIQAHLYRGHDFGLSLGALTCDLVITSRSRSNVQMNIFNLQEEIRHILLKSRLKIDISNIQQMLAMLKGTIRGCRPFIENSNNLSKFFFFQNSTNIAILHFSISKEYKTFVTIS
jgi:hypothetical protein